MGERQGQRTDKGELVADLPEVNPGQRTRDVAGKRQGQRTDKGELVQNFAQVEPGAETRDVAYIGIAKAPLPATYDAAKQALADCVSIDECKGWADKAQALASYARQADDDTLHKLALRIQSRAIRRAGELLKLFNSPGGRPAKTEAAADQSSQKQAGHDAGMSERQVKTAVRVARVPQETFDAAVEGDDPPTVTALAEMGKQAKQPRPVPEGFRQATHLIGALRDFARFCGEHAPEYVAGGVLPAEAAEVRQQVAAIDGWLDRFIVNLRD